MREREGGMEYRGRAGEERRGEKGGEGRGGKVFLFSSSNVGSYDIAYGVQQTLRSLHNPYTLHKLSMLSDNHCCPKCSAVLLNLNLFLISC